MMILQNENPTLFEPLLSLTRSVEEEALEFEEDVQDPLDTLEIFQLIRNINDPEHPHTLEQLNVVQPSLIHLHDHILTVRFTPTIPHCSMATLIGLCIRVRLLRSLPKKIKVDIRVTEGTHQSELAVNKQLNDKERVAAALENSQLLDIVNQASHLLKEMAANFLRVTSPVLMSDLGSESSEETIQSAPLKLGREERKIQDLEITNASLMSINASLEEQLRQQKATIQALQRQPQVEHRFTHHLTQHRESDIVLETELDAPSGSMEGPTSRALAQMSARVQDMIQLGRAALESDCQPSLESRHAGVSPRSCPRDRVRFIDSSLPGSPHIYYSC